MRRLLAFLLVFCCLCLSGCAEETGAAEVRLAALNVGKGDCLLLLLGADAYLIDSGYDYTSNLLMEALRQYGVSRLRGVFLSHCDKDHSGGHRPRGPERGGHLAERRGHADSGRRRVPAGAGAPHRKR